MVLLNSPLASRLTLIQIFFFFLLLLLLLLFFLYLFLFLFSLLFFFVFINILGQYLCKLMQQILLEHLTMDIWGNLSKGIFFSCAYPYSQYVCVFLSLGDHFLNGSCHILTRSLSHGLNCQKIPNSGVAHQPRSRGGKGAERVCINFFLAKIGLMQTQKGQGGMPEPSLSEGKTVYSVCSKLQVVCSQDLLFSCLLAALF